MSARFPLTSEQLELLLAFEASPSLSELASTLRRDPSVISRNLQKLAGDLPVLVKKEGRWRITPMGRRVNECSRDFLAKIGKIAGDAPTSKRVYIEPFCLPSTALLVVNAQAALSDPALRKRNNKAAEANIGHILAQWRKDKRPVFHIPHISANSQSAFFKGSPGSEPMRELAPKSGEPVVSKTRANAFAETGLEGLLKKKGIETLVITGFTAADCIDATARHARDLGYTTVVVGDATATRDLIGVDGKVHKAERVHAMVLAGLHQSDVRILDTEPLLKAIKAYKPAR